MASRFQAVPLVTSPTYSNAVAWSNENLVAIASGHFVTIVVILSFTCYYSLKTTLPDLSYSYYLNISCQNPAMPRGAKGLITIPNNKPFPIGVIDKKGTCECVCFFVSLCLFITSI